MKVRTRYVQRPPHELGPATYAIGIALSLVSAAGGAAAQWLPETVIGKAQIYDGVTFDVIQDGGRYRTATRIRLEGGRLLRAPAEGAPWKCGLAMWRSGNGVARNPDLGQGCRVPANPRYSRRRVSCPVLRQWSGHSSFGPGAGDVRRGGATRRAATRGLLGAGSEGEGSRCGYLVKRIHGSGRVAAGTRHV